MTYLSVTRKLALLQQKASGINAASIVKLGKNGNVTTEVLLKICTALDCDISDIMEIVKD
ncbi:hypothetical protein CP358_03720 [Lactobacillus sp. UMNPBX7]|nr:helix-turn-helix transcriptional regulator [Limosilactobacillus reuteri]PEG89804.1 hypothetical protein CP364_00400 [Lactobacillus sp. UMNPBX13]PEH00878.1 hypothetical protein CP358_03720 [Lactobacillus sp. UMNPBX7]